MTDLVLSVILYHASFWFARGAGKNSRIKRSTVLQKETLEATIAAAVKETILEKGIRARHALFQYIKEVCQLTQKEIFDVDMHIESACTGKLIILMLFFQFVRSCAILQVMLSRRLNVQWHRKKK